MHLLEHTHTHMQMKYTHLRTQLTINQTLIWCVCLCLCMCVTSVVVREHSHYHIIRIASLHTNTVISSMTVDNTCVMSLQPMKSTHSTFLKTLRIGKVLYILLTSWLLW